MINKFILLLKKKWEFKKIKNAGYLIFGHGNISILSKYIPKNNKEVVTFVVINFYIVYQLLINKEKFSKLNYFKQAIKIVNPSIIITLIDNDIDFYRLKKYFPDKKFIAIQNGYRTEPKKQFLIKKNEKLQCDIIFCFGKQNINYYKSFVETKVIVLGSLKNNLILRKNLKKKNIVTYISEYRPLSESIKIDFFSFGKTYWGNSLISEKKLVKVINYLCKKRNIKFYILGRHLDSNKEKELTYFSKIIGKDNFNYIAKKNMLSSYNFLTRSGTIISMASSLGYEFFSRNNKMIFFSKRYYNIKEISKYYKFGWPFINKKKGFFYSDDISNKEILRLAKNVIDCKQSKWLKKKKVYQENLISYNYRNILLKQELKINF
jgi:surface carbohydrate biosynthesis protein